MTSMKFIMATFLIIYISFSGLSQDTKKANILKTQAKELMAQKNYTDAIKRFEEYINLMKSFPEPSSDDISDAEFNLAQCYESSENYIVAITRYDKLIDYYLEKKDVPKIKKLINLIAADFSEVSNKNIPIKFSDTVFEKNTLYFRIYRVTKHEGRNFTVVLRGGTNDGIFNHSKGTVRGVYQKDDDRSFETGNAEVTETNPNFTTASVTVSDTSDKANWPVKGDLVALTVNIPKKYRTKFFDLASLNISFQTNQKELFFHLRHLIYFDRPALEDAISLAMANDVKETVDALGDEKNDKYASLYEPLKSGFYKGKTVVTVMKKVNKNDILSFASFVKGFPGKYMGGDWRIDETFATWVLNNAPVSAELIMDSLLVTKNENHLNNLFNICRDDSYAAKFVNDWNDIANKLSTNGYLDSAFRVNSLSVKYALLIFDKSQLAYAFFNKGELYYDANKYELSNENYDKALKIFIEINDYTMQAKCINNQALNLINLNRYQNSITKYRESLIIKLKILKKAPTLSAYESIGNSFWGLGFVNYKLGNYEEARVNYEKSLAYYDTANSSYSTKALVYKKLGNIYNKTGDYSQAIEKYKIARSLYDETGKVKDEADVIDEIGYNYSKIGNYDESLKSYEEAYELHTRANDIKNAAFTMSNIGQIKWNKGDYAGAIKSHEQSIAIKKEINDSNGLAYSYEKLGGLYKESGEPQKAKTFYENALVIYRFLNDSVSISDLLNTLGDLYYNLQDYPKSIDYYQNSCNIREKLNVKKEIAESYYNISYSCYKIKDYKKAKEYQLKSYSLRKEIDDKSGQLYSLSLLGIISQYYDYDYETAGKYITEALKMARITESKSYLAFCYANLADLYSSKGDLNKSEIYLDSARYYYVATDNKQEICNILLRIGSLYIDKGNFSLVLDYYSQSLKIANESNNKTAIANAYISMGNYYNLVGDFKTALKYENMGVDIYKEANNSWGLAASFVNIGNTYNYMGDYQAAMTSYNKSDSIYITLGDEISRLTPINNIGTIYFYQGDYKNALLKFYKAFEVLDSIKYEGEFMITAKWNIGENYFEDQVYPEAEKWLNEALELANKSGNTRKIPGVSLTLGKLKLAEKKYPEALQLLTTGYDGNVAMGEKERIIEASSFLGKLYYETNNIPKAKQYLTESTNLSKDIGSTKYLYEPLYTLAQIAVSEKDTANGVKLLTEAVDVLEGMKQKLAGGEIEKKLFVKSGPKVKIYELLVSSLVKQNKVKEAFFYQERANIEGLKEQTRGGDNRGANVLDEQTSTQDIQLKISGIYEQLVKEKSKPEGQQNKEKIKSLEQLMTVAQNNYQGFIDSVITQNENLQKSFSKNISPEDLDDARRHLPDDVAAIEYLLAENQLIIFIASKTLLEAKVVEVKKADFEQFINSFYYQIITKGDEEKIKSLAVQLYSFMINPIADEIKDKKKLALVPTGKLFKIPFQAIGNYQNGKNFRYLIEDFSLYYINDLKSVIETGNTSGGEIKIVAFGNADSTLPNAEIEVNDIKKIFNNTLIYVKHNATKDVVRQNIVVYPYIHFATHGNLDPVNFKNSYLVLAPNVAKGEDGRFTIDEIRAFNTLSNCQLITLSACNTAVNTEKVEGWLNNPAKEFIKKGARSVIASLWSVEDLATSKLMQQFYTNLKNNETKVDALRDAQIMLLKTPGFTHPNSWAAFELIGDWR